MKRTMILVAALVALFASPSIVVAQTSGGGGFTPRAPFRALDTRAGAKVGANGAVDVLVGSGAAAAAVNITVVEPDADGFVTAYASGTTRPNASSVNYVAGQTVPNFAIVPVGGDGRIRLYTYAATHLLVDVTGTFGAGGPTPPTPPPGANLTAQITNYEPSPSGSYTNVSGTATNHGSATLDVAIDLQHPTGAASSTYVFDLAPGATGSWSDFVTGSFTSGSLILRVYEF